MKKINFNYSFIAFILCSCCTLKGPQNSINENKIVKLEYYQIMVQESFSRLGVNDVMRMSGSKSYVDSQQRKKAFTNFGIIDFPVNHIVLNSKILDSLTNRLNELISILKIDIYGIDSNTFNPNEFNQFDYRGVFILNLTSNRILLLGRNNTNGFSVNEHLFKHNAKSRELFTIIQEIIKLNCLKHSSW